MFETYNQENEDYLQNLSKKTLQDKEKVEFSKPVYLRKQQTLIGFPQPNVDDFIQISSKSLIEQLDFMKTYFESENCEKQRVEWMTITDTKIEMVNFNIKGKIHLTCKSNLLASLMSFESIETSKAPACIEIFANSYANFDHCYFHDSKKASVIVRDFSWAKFTNCIFEGNLVSCLIQNNSYVEFENCLFINDKNITIYLLKNSQASIKNCLFKKDNKAIFGKDDCLIKIEDSKFEECQKSAVTISEKSTLLMSNVEINDSLSTAIRATGRSTVKVNNVQINNTKGNALNIENADGYFYKSTITNNTEFPTISVRGRYANPIFSQCEVIDNGSTFAVVIKNCSRPIFDNCLFKNCDTNCFSISDFSMPLIKDCQFKNMKKLTMNIFGSSKVTLIGTYSSDKIKISQKSQIFTEETRNEEEKYTMSESEIEESIANITTAKSWKPPSYKEVPKIQNDDKNPFEIELKPLLYVSIEKVVKNENSENVNHFKCCNHHDHDDSELFVSYCGHCLCKNCVHTNCPVCDTPVKDAKKLFCEEQCVICMDHAADTVVTSCGHMCMCYECAVKCVEQNYKCPLCNQPIQGYRCMLDD